ncbi:MAG: pre-peptidase C-terminal domain-containing protein, partial [Lentisphaeria bacterium]|nr:pre-peptidase C-terminal domain-containing protein [Lentisphaeria bacterium]
MEKDFSAKNVVVENSTEDTLVQLRVSGGGHLLPGQKTNGNLQISGNASPVMSYFTIDATKQGFVAGIDGLTWSDFQYSDWYAGYYYQNDIIIDTEKCTSISNDDMMCWAASTANMLYYTGWNAGLEGDEDEIFDVFINNFMYGAYYGGNSFYGADWFVTGTYSPADGQWSGWDMPYEGTGGYYSNIFDNRDYNFSIYVDYYGMDADVLYNVESWLADGYALGLSFGYYLEDGSRDGGHAVTLWGLTYDTSLSVNDPNYYTGIIITDSDDDGWSISDKENAEDTLKIISMTYDSSRNVYVLDPDYAGDRCWLDGVTVLAQNPGFVPGSQPEIPDPSDFADAYEPNNSFESAADLGSADNGITLDNLSIHTNDDDDYFKFTVSETELVSISTDGTSGDTQLFLYDAEGNQIAYNDDGGNNGYFSHISTSLNAGDYFIKVQSYNHNSTIADYSVSIDVRAGSVWIYLDDQLIEVADSFDGKVLDSGYDMYVYNGGTANNTTVAGWMDVYDGGTATNTTVN